MADTNNKADDITIWNDTMTKNVSVITDGSVERLAVDATISGDESPTKYTPKFDFDAVGDALVTIADTSLFLFTGQGVVDFVGIGGSNSNFIIVIKIDGVEVLRISTAELSAIGLVNTTTSPMWVETADKNFRWNPNEGAGFSTSFEILSRATAVPLPTVAHLITYRKKT